MSVQASKVKPGAWYKTPGGREVSTKAVKVVDGKVKFDVRGGGSVLVPVTVELKPLGSSSGPAKPQADDDELAEMRRDHEAAQARKDGDYGDRGESYLDKLEWGSNVRRVLPREGTPTFYKKVKVHYDVGTKEEGSTKKSIRCIKGCRVCARADKEVAKVNAKYEKGSEEGKKAWRKVQEQYGAKTRFLLDLAQQNDEGEWTVKVLPAAQSIGDELLDKFFDSMWGDFTDPETGRDVDFKKLRKKGQPPTSKLCDYKVSISPEASEFEGWNEVKDMRHNLDEVADSLFPVLEPAQQDALMNGTFDEADDDAEAEEKPKKPARGPVLASKAKEGSWYLLGTGDKAECMENPTSKGNVKFRTEDGTEKFYKPTSTVTPCEAPEASEDAPEDEDDAEAAGGEDEQPGCFGDPADHNPKDATCKACGFFKKCAATPEVQAKVYKIGKKPGTKEKLRQAADE